VFAVTSVRLCACPALEHLTEFFLRADKDAKDHILCDSQSSEIYHRNCLQFLYSVISKLTLSVAYQHVNLYTKIMLAVGFYLFIYSFLTTFCYILERFLGGFKYF